MESSSIQASFNIEKQATSSSLRAEQNMKQKLTNSFFKFQYQDDEIMAGSKFKMQYLGCVEELEFGGTDNEIANVIHDIHTLYTWRNIKLSKARSVFVTVDAEKINILDENEDEVLLTFLLVHVKDVTTCLDGAPYSKTCVLVAKPYNEPLYKAFVFYAKNTAHAAEFYHFTTRAFQLGFQRMETFAESLDSESITDGALFETPNSPSGSIRKLNGKVQVEKNSIKACIDEDVTDPANYFAKSFPESQKLLKSGTEVARLKETDERKKSWQQATTVLLSNNDRSSAKHEKGDVKFNLHLGEDNNNLKPLKLGVYLDTVGETSRFLIPHWFRNSYRKFRKFSSGQRLGRENPEDV